MDIQTQVESLVISADRNFLNLPNFSELQNNPEKPLKLLESTLQKYAPVFQLRCTALAWEYAYDSYLKSTTIQPLSYDLFRFKCVTNFENHKLYVQALEYVSSILPENITLDYVGLARKVQEL